jgi:hypothetical protein
MNTRYEILTSHKIVILDKKTKRIISFFIRAMNHASDVYYGRRDLDLEFGLLWQTLDRASFVLTSTTSTFPLFLVSLLLGSS